MISQGEDKMQEMKTSNSVRGRIASDQGEVLSNF